MTSTQKPNVIIFNGINFNPSFYSSESSLYLTQQGALGSFLSYPIAQGTETLQNTNINGILSINGIQQYKNANNVLVFNNPNNNPSGYAFTMPNTVGSNPNQLIIYPAGIQINNKLQLNGFPLSLDSVNNVGLALDLSYTRFNLVNGNSLFSFVSSIGASPLMSITSSQTTINTATQINSLTSTTQPNGTNNTNVATTAFVANAISSLPSTLSQMPYLWGITNNIASSNSPIGSFSLNFTGSSWGINAWFTIRYMFQCEWVIGASTNPYQYYQQWTGVMNVYPNRVPTVSATAICLLSGSINGNLNYSMIDATYAPNNRWYWVEDYSNSNVVNSTNNVPNNIFINSTNQSSITFVLNPPLLPSTPCGYRITTNIQILQQGTTGLTISSSGISSIFNNYYNTF